MITISLNTYELIDSIYNSIWNIRNKPEKSGQFFSTDANNPSTLDKSNTLWQVTFQMSGRQVLWSRKVYQLLDMIGDIGGFNDALVMIFESFMGYYAPVLFL